MSAEELALKRQKIKAVMDAMRMPSAADMMRTAIADLKSDATVKAVMEGDEEGETFVLRALHELSQLVEPIDNANDLHKLGGLLPLAPLLRFPAMAPMAALVLGKAAQNNPQVQQQVLETGLLSALLYRLHVHPARRVLTPEVEARLLYALSAALRNHGPALHCFFRRQGATLLASLLNRPAFMTPSPRTPSKVLSMVADIADWLGEMGEKPWEKHQKEEQGQQGKDSQQLSSASVSAAAPAFLYTCPDAAQMLFDGECPVGSEDMDVPQPKAAAVVASEPLADEELLRAVVGTLRRRVGGGGGEGSAGEAEDGTEGPIDLDLIEKVRMKGFRWIWGS
eukprot:TRINITY_DN35620_c0_g1_i2.p1 TRINITY_DN35620_c0_g1~~TRINITY_DN35620_c0_g1_i2.p1  ORF type:complete len:356 (+),score=28.54 TRINITY_DN35620_c0_g1_i2:57-1070(+)